ncbi:MAG: HPF/RaiA family ribosome-associated protein [Desulfurivibrionaceae bacterium]
MEVPPEIVFHDVKKTDALEELIREKIAKLEKLTDKIISCRVAVDQPPKHKQSGNPWEVHINLKLPSDKEVVVKQGAGRKTEPEDLGLTINEAFNAAERQLKKTVEKMKGK